MPRFVPVFAFTKYPVRFYPSPRYLFSLWCIYVLVHATFIITVAQRKSKEKFWLNFYVILLKNDAWLRFDLTWNLWYFEIKYSHLKKCSRRSFCIISAVLIMQAYVGMNLTEVSIQKNFTSRIQKIENMDSKFEICVL